MPTRGARLLSTLAAAGCLPIPVSTLPFHAREERAVAVESARLPNDGTFSSPPFDSSGALFAVYDSSSNRVRIFRSADLTLADSLEPARRPRRLGFSSGGNFLVIEERQGWVDDYLRGVSLDSNVDIDSPAARPACAAGEWPSIASCARLKYRAQ